jgi:hypothetical protein
LIRIPGRASFFDHLIAEYDALRVILLESLIGKLWRREYLEVVDVANLFVGRHRSKRSSLVHLKLSAVSTWKFRYEP